MHFWVVAAGTGGHIFPGLAVVSELEKIQPCEPLFFGSRGRLEETLVPEHGYRLRVLEAGRWKGRGPLARLHGLLAIAVGFFRALALGIQHRPEFLLSVGGYVSIPVGLAAAVLRIPIFLIEPNAVSGIANRVLSHFARRAFVSLGSDGADRFRCPIEFGVPVREGLSELVLRPQVNRVSVLGGSQGARHMTVLVLNAFQRLTPQWRPRMLFLQAGHQHEEAISQEIQSRHMQDWVQVESFVGDMGELYRESDLVISRAGASTLNEILQTKNPSVLIPFPHAADDHQRRNAKALVDAGGAYMVDERSPSAEQELEQRIFELCVAPEGFERRIAMGNALKQLPRQMGASEIAEKILQGLTQSR